MSFAVGADAYDRFMGRNSTPLAPQFADLGAVDAGQRVLDVGCGPGALTAELVERLGPSTVSAVDPSEPFVAAARERHPGVDVRRAAAEELPFQDLHALLLTIAPGYHEQIRDLTSSASLLVARRLASRARGTDRVRSSLACSAITRLRSLSGEIGVLEREITSVLDQAAPANLLSICGVGPLVAAKILGEVRDVGRFSSAADSWSGNSWSSETWSDIFHGTASSGNAWSSGIWGD